MKRNWVILLLKSFVFIPSLLFCSVSCTSTNTDHLSTILAETTVLSNIPYAVVDSTPLYLDAYLPATLLGREPWVEFSRKRKPTLLYFHGGGWTEGDRTSRSLFLLPYIEKGWCVVTADYRLLGKSNLLDCIQDCQLALSWVYEHADQYKFDTTRIVVSGESAGGHLALMTGLAANASRLNSINASMRHNLTVSAIINWYGISDVEKAVAFWNSPDYTQQIVGNHPAPKTLLQVASPVQYISPKSAPILSIHGDQDVNVPISQSEALHALLLKNGVKNQFVRIHEKRHGNFSPQEYASVYKQIWEFLGY